MKFSEFTTEAVRQRLDPKCWKGKHKEGTKIKGGVRVNNCVPNESVEESKEERCMQCGMTNCSCTPGKCGCKPIAGWVPGKGFKKAMDESFNGEYNDEAGMFKNDLQTIQRVSTHLEKEIYDNENLPEWCQAKIAQAKGMVVAVMDYMISQHENGIVDAVNEEFDLIERIIDNLAKHNGVDSEVIWEDLESLTDDELYVFATTTTIMETEAWQKANNKDKTDGMSRKAVKTYRREHPGSKLQTAVTTKPSKLKKGSKSSKRRKSYCSRSKGQMNMHNISCAKTPDKAICKARRRWNC